MSELGETGVSPNPILKLKKPLTLKVTWKDGTWFVECEELGICSSGDTLPEAAKTFQDYLVALATETTEEERALEEYVEVGRTPPSGGVRVKLEFERLRHISQYFGFPVAAFFAPLDSLRMLDGRKVDDDVKKKLEALEKIRAILEGVE